MRAWYLGRSTATGLLGKNSAFAAKPAARLMIMLALASMSCGCLSKQITRDGIELRQAVQDMYTDQVMDNLIRAKNNMPFVMLSYSAIQNNDFHDLGATASIDQSISSVMNLIVAGATRTVLKDYKESATGDCKRTMSFNAEPVTTQNDVYQKFIDFVKVPGQLEVSRQPPRCAVHIMRKSGHCYYWVPCEHGPAFFDLCMKTTFMRGKDDPPVTIPGFTTVTIKDVMIIPLKGKDPDRPDLVNANIQFNKKVPNDSATLVVDLPDRKITLRLYHMTNVPIAPDNTDTLFAQWDMKSLNLQPAELKGRTARLYSYTFPAELQPPPPALDQINTTLNTIRNQLQNQSTGKK